MARFQDRSERTSLILATDLDGTFAGGTPTDRELLQRILAELPGALLIYVTGRSVPATRELMLELPLPHPDVLIADVGTSVRSGPTLDPVVAIETELDRVWPGGDLIRARLEGVAELEEQDVKAPRRVSYWIREGSMVAATDLASKALSDLEVDLVASAGVYLDVLPGAVNKGSTLRRVLLWLERGEADVVVAGDTLNDLALFETGLCGVVVGNCEEALRDRVGALEHLYLAGGEGAAGILEGLRHFGWLDEELSHGE
jgi:hydroxymethylpyrimidine pyrophosphatase-like HAD family hydrolase